LSIADEAEADARPQAGVQNATARSAALSVLQTAMIELV
jgi:hypothetical protein